MSEVLCIKLQDVCKHDGVFVLPLPRIGKNWKAELDGTKKHPIIRAPLEVRRQNAWSKFWACEVA